MYGKCFDSMYKGSMIGKGAVVFAVMGYVISHQKPPDFIVELNPQLLAFILGEPVEKVEEAIAVLASPDPKSRSEGHEGRRLIKVGTYAYEVVNGKAYHEIRTAEDLRAYWRGVKTKSRAKGKEEQADGEPVEQKAVSRSPKIPASVDEVIEFGKTCMPEPVPESVCRSFWSYYEGQAEVGPNGETFWVTAGGSVISNWKVKLPEFHAKGKYGAGEKSTANQVSKTNPESDPNSLHYKGPSHAERLVEQKRRQTP